MKSVILSMLLLTNLIVYGQGFEFGVRAGMTATGGTTKLPAYSFPSGFPNVNIHNDQINANQNGMGYNFLAGLYGKVNLPLSFFVQLEAIYTQFSINQQASNLNLTMVSPAGSAPFQSYNTVDIKSNLNGINVPVLLGKHFAAKLLRAYIGPNFLFVTAANQTLTYNGGTSYAGPMFPAKSGSDPKEDLTQNPTSPTLPNRAVNSLIIGLEAGIGVNVPKTNLAFDLRYSVPLITGVYKYKNISGYLGIISLSASYRLFKAGL